MNKHAFLLKATKLIGTFFLLSAMLIVTNPLLVFSLIFVEKNFSTILVMLVLGIFVGPWMIASFSTLFDLTQKDKFFSWKNFISNYRTSFKDGILIGVIQSFVNFIFTFNIVKGLQLASIHKFLLPTIILGIILNFIFLFSYFLTMKFERTTLKNTFLNSLILFFRHLFISIRTLFTMVGIVFIMIFLPIKIWLFLLLPLILYVFVINEQQIFQSLISENKKAIDNA